MRKEVMSRITLRHEGEYHRVIFAGKNFMFNGRTLEPEKALSAKFGSRKYSNNRAAPRPFGCSLRASHIVYSKFGASVSSTYKQKGILPTQTLYDGLGIGKKSMEG